MKWQAMLTIAVLSLVATATGGKETPTERHLLALDLRDGSHLRGTTKLESIPMDTPHGKLDLSIELIRTIAFAEKPAKGAAWPEARADFRGGDVLHGRIGQKVFELETPYGKTTVPVARIVRMDVCPVGLAAGLVGFWTGDGHAMDSLGRHHGTHPEAVTYTTDRYGNPRGAFCFNGQGGLVTLPDHDELDTDNAFTLSVWINPKTYRNKAGKEGWILSKHYDSPEPGDYILRLLTNGKILFGVTNYAKPLRGDKPGISAGLASDAATPVPKNAWTHVAATFDRGAMYLYVNGKLVAGKASTAVKCTDPREYPHDDVCIGAVWNNGGSFTGAIDDVGIWNRALRGEEIAALAGLAAKPPRKKAPVAFWKADGNTKDSVGPHHGRAGKGVCYTADRHDKASGAFLFDGQSAHVDCGAPDLKLTDKMTVAAWVKPKVFSADPDHSTIVTRARTWYFQIDRAGKLAVSLQRALPDPKGPDYYVATKALRLNVWSHVAFTYDGRSLKLYVNGVLRKSFRLKGKLSRDHLAYHIGIGMNLDSKGKPYPGHNRRFNGAIDDVGIWNRALSAAEVAKLASTDIAGGRPDGPAVCAKQGE